MDDCIGCDQCAKACPVNCIDIETVKSLPDEDLGKTSNGKKKALWVTTFDIDIAKCCYCQLCVFPCPTECIWMTDVYEFSEFERENLIYNFATLTPQEAEEKKKNYEEYKAKKDAEKEAAKKAKQTKASSEKPAASKGTEKDKSSSGKPSQKEVKQNDKSSSESKSSEKLSKGENKAESGEDKEQQSKSQDESQQDPKNKSQDNSENNSDKKEEQ
jgi:NADH-quinone oxidoreductase subunit I